MKYNGFYFWMFKGSMKKVLAEEYGKTYAAEIMKKSKKVYRELVKQADDIGDDNPMAYNELFALAFVAPYIASEKKIPPETVQEMMRRSLYHIKWYFSRTDLNTNKGKADNKKNIAKYESEFAKIVMGHSIKAAEQERQLKQKELHTLNARNDELDNLFEHIYEDNVSGKISDDRFAKLSVKYESEQKEITARIKDLETELDTEKSKAVTADMFMASVRKYTRARKLTPRMLNELIEKIEVHQSEKIDGKTVQQLTIHYNCIGNIEIPDLEKLPENNVSVHTRQGVDVHFAACAS